MKNAIVILFTCFLASCNMTDDADTTVDLVQDEPRVSPAPPAGSAEVAAGTFTGYAHSLAGSASINIDSENRKSLRFKNFTMTSGPDVYVFASKSNNYSKANTIGVAKLSNSYTNVDLSIDLSDSIDTKEYKFVLVYCVQFNSLFGFAELK